MKYGKKMAEDMLKVSTVYKEILEERKHLKLFFNSDNKTHIKGYYDEYEKEVTISIKKFY